MKISILKDCHIYIERNLKAFSKGEMLDIPESWANRLLEIGVAEKEAKVVTEVKAVPAEKIKNKALPKAPENKALKREKASKKTKK